MPVFLFSSNAYRIPEKERKCSGFFLTLRQRRHADQRLYPMLNCKGKRREDSLLDLIGKGLLHSLIRVIPRLNSRMNIKANF